MRVVAQKADLVEALSIVNRAVSSRSSLQVLSGVLLEAKSDGMTVSGTDMEISIKAPLVGGSRRPGAVVVPARIVTDIAKNLPVQEVTIEQRPGETQVEIRAGESLFVLHAMQSADFPQFPVFPLENGFTVEKDAFLETIDRVAPSASRDETRPVLTGVLIHVTKNSVKMVATDSYRLERQGDRHLDVDRRSYRGHHPRAVAHRARADRRGQFGGHASRSYPARTRCCSTSAASR